MYFIIQKGYAIFGSGATKEEAVQDFKQWIDADDKKQNWSVSDFETCYSAAFDGQMVLIEATEEILEMYQ